VDLPSKVVLPDGSVHGPGKLTSCNQGTHSPTRTLLELSIDGHPVHLVLGGSARSEAAGDTPPFFVFLRDKQDRLVLQGYAVPARGNLVTYTMYPTRDRFHVTSTWEVLALEASGEARRDPSTVLLTASH
jgi:hypothetical protein